MRPMNNPSDPSNVRVVRRFDDAVTALIHEFSGTLYYHEMIGVLAMHQHSLATQSGSDYGDEED